MRTTITPAYDLQDGDIINSGTDLVVVDGQRHEGDFVIIDVYDLATQTKPDTLEKRVDADVLVVDPASLPR